MKYSTRELLEFGYSQEETFETQSKIDTAQKIKESIKSKFTSVEIEQLLKEFKESPNFLINEEALVNLKNKQLLIALLIFHQISKNGSINCYDFYKKFNFTKDEFYKTLKKIEAHSKQIKIIRERITNKNKKGTFRISFKKTKSKYTPTTRKFIKFNEFNQIALCLLLNGKNFVSFLRIMKTKYWNNKDFVFKCDRNFLNEAKLKKAHSKQSFLSRVRSFTKITNSFIKMKQFRAWKFFKFINSLVRDAVDFWKIEYDKLCKTPKTTRYVNLNSLFFIYKNNFIKQFL
ncbi:hypothetical protein [Mycoplasmopsis glycophila]|uniref:hypothetical protein n=1 Tax=Mycoplasmopsis glycophila TaxID=171285 RepID=UPI00101C752E|nr:hypothetical protein [Mycoplasmopsis glycophila]